jgi:hypothetical protein
VRRRALTAATFVLVAASVAVAVMEGVPSRLPGVALGSPVLLQAERALALLAVTVGALSVAVQAARGRLPLGLSTSGLRYGTEVVDDAAAAVADVQAQLDDLARFVVEFAERLDALSRHPSPVRSTVSTQPTTAPQPRASAVELSRAMQARNAVRRAEVERRVASLRQIAERLRAAGR